MEVAKMWQKFMSIGIEHRASHMQNKQNSYTPTELQFWSRCHQNPTLQCWGRGGETSRQKYYRIPLTKQLPLSFESSPLNTGPSF